jgi:hypothetical protein
VDTVHKVSAEIISKNKDSFWNLSIVKSK